MKSDIIKQLNNIGKKKKKKKKKPKHYIDDYNAGYCSGINHVRELLTKNSVMHWKILHGSMHLVFTINIERMDAYQKVIKILGKNIGDKEARKGC